MKVSGSWVSECVCVRTGRPHASILYLPFFSLCMTKSVYSPMLAPQSSQPRLSSLFKRSTPRERFVGHKKVRKQVHVCKHVTARAFVGKSRLSMKNLAVHYCVHAKLC